MAFKYCRITIYIKESSTIFACLHVEKGKIEIKVNLMSTILGCTGYLANIFHKKKEFKKYTNL